MSGVRKLIYVKSQEVWDEIEAAAERIDRSVSWYLIDCHRQVSEKPKDVILKFPEDYDAGLNPVALGKDPSDISSEPIEEMIEEQKERIDGKRVYSEEPTTVSTAPKKPGKKATIEKLQNEIDPGWDGKVRAQLKNKDKK